MADDDGKTIFNDPDKLQRTKQNMADYFQTGPNYGDKLKGLLGISDANADDMSTRRQDLARKMVYRDR